MKINENGVSLSIRVTPNASRNQITMDNSEQLSVKLTSPPVDGKANKDLVKHLAKFFKIPSTSIQIIRGANSRNKVVLLQDAAESDISKKLESAK